MKTPKKIPKYISEFIHDLEWFFSLAYHDCTIVLQKEAKGNVGAQIEMDEKYQQITLRIYPSFWSLSKKEQIDCLVHEYVHYLIYPIQLESEKALLNEFTNQERLTHALEKVTSSVTERFTRLFDSRSAFIRKGYKKAISK